MLRPKETFWGTLFPQQCFLVCGGPYRLRVVSNFGDGDCGADEIHTRARNFEETRREGIFGAPFASRLLDLSRARVYFARATIAIAKIRDHSQSTGLTSSLLW